MKAIITKWECASCGNVLTKQEVFAKTATGKHSFNAPKKCTCGAQSRFRLLSFESATAKITADDLTKPRVEAE